MPPKVIPENGIAGPGRAFAALIALVCWTSLALQAQVDIAAALARGDTVTGALWRLIYYYTILTNLLTALTLTSVARGRHRGGSPWLTAVAVYMTMLGILNHFLLGGIRGRFGERFAADVGLHYVAPALVLVFWLACVPKSGLRSSHPSLFLCYPLAYCAYALVRGGLSGRYPYFFIDAGSLGPGRTLLNVCMLTVGFLAAGFVFLGIARMMRGSLSPETPSEAA